MGLSKAPKEPLKSFQRRFLLIGEQMKTCTTCNKIVTGEQIEFKCPGCGKTNIIRCEQCKRSAKTYNCKECGFEGP